MTKKKEMRKLAGKAVTIEDIWESISSVKGGLNPPASNTVLTPRSAEACLKHGVNPEILRVRPLESFQEAGIDLTVQRLRHESYTQRRFEMMRIVRSERKKLVNQEEREKQMQITRGGSHKKKAKITPAQILAEQAKQNATFVEEEQKRMLKMRRRQEKELEQMLAFEAKMQEIQAERDRKMEEERRKTEAIRREKEKRARERAEEQRIRELKKASQAEAEEQQRQAQVRAMFQRERCIRAEQEKADRKAKQEARAKEEERLRKQEEHRLQTRRILSEQQAAIKRRMEDMELAEHERQKLIDKKRQEECKRLEAKRAQAEARIQRNVRQAVKVEQIRKEQFFQKQAQHDELQRQNAQMQARERELKQHQADLQEQRRQMILEQSKRDEEKRKEELLGKFEFEDSNVRRVREEREKKLRIAHEKRLLRNHLKLENVERIRRVNEYRRLETLRKISDADQRISDMQNRKQQLIRMRKQNALTIKIQKDKLLAVMENAKTAGPRAKKLIQDSFENASPTRPQSASKRISPQTPLPRANSASALYNEAQKVLGPPPDVPTAWQQSNDYDDMNQQLPYVSPYDAPPQKATISL